jgi:hypothetical protein
MSEWSDIASCYRWLHDQSEKFYHSKNLWINLPVIILTTLGGTASIGVQSMFNDNPVSKQYASFAIGGVSLFAGILTTIGNYLRFAQLEESNRVASIAWGKFQRLIAVELALHPTERMDSLDFLKICRSDLDRLIEQSPPIPQYAIDLFRDSFGNIKDLKKPDICGALEHTNVFQSNETRLKKAAVDAALFLKQKRGTLSEFLAPQIQEKIKEQVKSQLEEAIEERRQKLEEEIQMERVKTQVQKEEHDKLIRERRESITKEIEEERKKIVDRRVSDSRPYVPLENTYRLDNTYQGFYGMDIVPSSIIIPPLDIRRALDNSRELDIPPLLPRSGAEMDSAGDSANDSANNNAVDIEPLHSILSHKS